MHSVIADAIKHIKFLNSCTEAFHFSIENIKDDYSAFD